MRSLHIVSYPIACKSIILFEQIRMIDKRRLREYMGTLDKRFLLAMDKALAISIGLNRYLHCPMKQGRLSVSLPAHECCPLHDDSVQKKRISPLVIWYNHSLIH